MTDHTEDRPPRPSRTIEEQALLLLIVAISVGFFWILWPFYGVVLWAVVIAILFAPAYRRLSRSMQGRRTPAALATVLIVVLIVILPLTLFGISLVQETVSVIDKTKSGEMNFARYFQEAFNALPAWAATLLDRFGLTNLGAVLEQFSAGLVAGSQYLTARALAIGQNAFEFIVELFLMLYLLFFMLRDGEMLMRRIKAATPLREKQQRALFSKFTIVIRATVKGNIVVALMQGALGGLIFWFLGIHAPTLWGVLMAFLSLLPAVGAAVVWLPVAVYLLLTGSVWEGVVLIAFGVVVIGLVDNVMRPMLVGKDTKLPDYVVLMSTLGGIAVFGLNGFVLGPVIAALFMACWDLFTAERGGQIERGPP